MRISDKHSYLPGEAGAVARGGTCRDADPVEEKRISSEFEPARFWMYWYCSFFWLLLFFYMSAINAAFFRSMRDVVASADESNIDIMINSFLMQVMSLRGKSHTIIVLLGASLFLAYGMVPHIDWCCPKAVTGYSGPLYPSYSPWRWMHWSRIRSIVAYDLRVMMNMADEGWKWYASINFLPGTGLGLGLWYGVCYTRAAIAEKGKKNVEVRGRCWSMH